MVAKDYIGAMVYSNEIIYIDTASLMNVKELDRFIRNSEDILLSENRKIVVPKAVCLELVRHLGSDNREKQEMAMRVLEIIKEHSDVFDVHNNELNEDESFRAFADAEILAELTRNKQYCGQLLITNDRALSEDAYSLNNQGSCRGHQIMVCFINRLGELRKCECTKVSSKEIDKEETGEEPVRIIIRNEAASSVQKEEKKELENSSYDVPVSEADNSSSAWNIWIPIGTYLLGFFSHKYGKAAIKTITSFF